MSRSSSFPESTSPSRSSTTVRVQPLIPRPGEPPVPERPHLERLGDTDRQEIRLDQQDRSPRRQARRQVADRSLGVGDVVQHRARGHEIEIAGIHRALDDVALPQLEARRRRLDEREIEIEGDCLAARLDPLGEPGGDRAVAATNLERPGARADAERLDVAAVHRVEQARHQRQPPPLTPEVMVQDVLGHAWDRTPRPDRTPENPTGIDRFATFRTR
jgi:hypothetical protein